jgi:hypothetical protein
MNAAEQRAQFVDALRSDSSGRIDLAKDDDPATVQRRLREAAYELGLRVESEWLNDARRVLRWKRVASHRPAEG